MRHYRDHLSVTEELRGYRLDCARGEIDERRCVFLNAAAAHFRSTTGVDQALLRWWP